MTTEELSQTQSLVNSISKSSMYMTLCDLPSLSDVISDPWIMAELYWGFPDGVS